MKHKPHKAGPPTTDATAEELIAAGYCRVSNAYLTVARIDREDWVQEMARSLRRAPAGFYAPGESEPCGSWCDYYRRSLSADTHVVDEATFRALPSSGWNNTGYCPPLIIS